MEKWFYQLSKTHLFIQASCKYFENIPLDLGKPLVCLEFQKRVKNGGVDSIRTFERTDKQIDKHVCLLICLFVHICLYVIYFPVCSLIWSTRVFLTPFTLAVFLSLFWLKSSHLQSHNKQKWMNKQTNKNCNYWFWYRFLIHSQPKATIGTQGLKPFSLVLQEYPGKFYDFHT